MSGGFVFRFFPKQIWPRRPMLVAGAALALTIGIHMTNLGDPKQVNPLVTTPLEQDEPSNTKVVDKEQTIDIHTFDQKDSPLWAFVEELRRAELRGDLTVTDPKFED